MLEFGRGTKTLPGDGENKIRTMPSRRQNLKIPCEESVAILKEPIPIEDIVSGIIIERVEERLEEDEKTKKRKH